MTAWSLIMEVRYNLNLDQTLIYWETPVNFDWEQLLELG